MKITDIRIRKTEKDGKLKAYASVTFDDEFAVHGIRVIDGANGLFIAMPSRTNKEGEFVDIAHPITKEFQKELSEAVLAKYKEN